MFKNSNFSRITFLGTISVRPADMHVSAFSSSIPGRVARCEVALKFMSQYSSDTIFIPLHDSEVTFMGICMRDGQVYNGAHNEMGGTCVSLTNGSGREGGHGGGQGGEEGQ